MSEQNLKLEVGERVRRQDKPHLGYGIVKGFKRSNVVLDWYKRSGFVREVELDSENLYKAN